MRVTIDEPKFDRHPSVPFDGKMSRDAFESLNEAMGERTIPPHVGEFPFDHIVVAHRRINQGHVEGSKCFVRRDELNLAEVQYSCAMLKVLVGR